MATHIIVARPAREPEGDDREPPDRAVALEFPNLEAARARCDVPGYAPPIAMRRGGTIAKPMPMEGVR